jgi:hypothetical protein
LGLERRRCGGFTIETPVIESLAKETLSMLRAAIGGRLSEMNGADA